MTRAIVPEAVTVLAGLVAVLVSVPLYRQAPPKMFLTRTCQPMVTAPEATVTALGSVVAERSTPAHLEAGATMVPVAPVLVPPSETPTLAREQDPVPSVVWMTNEPVPAEVLYGSGVIAADAGPPASASKAEEDAAAIALR